MEKEAENREKHVLSAVIPYDDGVMRADFTDGEKRYFYVQDQAEESETFNILFVNHDLYHDAAISGDGSAIVWEGTDLSVSADWIYRHGRAEK